MTRRVIGGAGPLVGRVRLPGCKGISHRALLLAAVADGRSTLRNLATGEDVARTRRALAALGIECADADGSVAVAGRGFDAMAAPGAPIDCGNSGTTMRMLAGLLSGRPFESVLVGDASLSRRPMDRVVEPLRRLGARIGTTDGHAPVTVTGGVLTGAEIDLPLASGQVKSALLLAGLQASGTTTVREPAPSRDHTERLLAALGAPLTRVDDRTVRVGPVGALDRFDLEVPGDASSAAFLVVAAATVPGSEVRIEGVNLNPQRIAYLDVLEAMGADITRTVEAERLGEPVGTVVVRHAPLRGTRIASTEGIVDELPILAVAAACATGPSEIADAAELRVKESDRIATTAAMLEAFGVAVAPTGDGLVITGGRRVGATVDSAGDHRIAMCAAVAALTAEGSTTIDGWDAVDVSFPGFDAVLASLEASA